jgi:hypothetical protein
VIRRLFLNLPVLALLLAGALTGGSAFAAPVERMVGPYRVTFGYVEEPAYMEELTTIRVEVYDTAGVGVTGLEHSLQARGRIQVLDITRDFDLSFYTFEDRPGVYEAVFIPPKPGEYTYWLTGMVRDTSVNESYSTGDLGLAPIAVRTDIEYGERGSILATIILAAYVAGLGALLLFLWRRRARRRHAFS